MLIKSTLICILILSWNQSMSQGHALFCVNILEEIEYYMAEVENERWYIENANDYADLWDGEPNRDGSYDYFTSKNEFINDYIQRKDALEKKLLTKSTLYKNICD